MKLSTRSRYGTRILLELARQSDGNPVQVGTISRHQDISVKYLEQLIRTLKKAGLVTSVRGARGGHILARAPEAISLGAIVRLFEEQHELVKCISSPDICQMADECRVRLAWKEATDALYERLDAITIADLLCEPTRSTKKNRPLKIRKA
ncbi:MAG: Rrf2 family transcriptional regulator [Desulfobacterales bacterium]|nr:Rrf2 family transcriptional regulator [Desulfobacterales bacterium]